MSDTRKERIDPAWVERAAVNTFGPTTEYSSGEAPADSSRNLADALYGCLDQAYRARGKRFRRLQTPEQQTEAAGFLRNLAGVIEADQLSQPVLSTQGKLDIGTFKYSPHAIEIALFNGLASSSVTVELEGRQKRMLAYMAGISKMKVGRYIYPWTTRAELAQMAGDLSPDQFQTGLLDPLNKVGVIQINGRFGFRLNCEPEDALEVVVARGDQQSLKLKLPEEWYEVRTKPALFYPHQLPVINYLNQQAIQAKNQNTPLDIVQLGLDTGLSKGSLYIQLKRFIEQGLLPSIRKGESYKVASLNRVLLETVIKAQRPFKIVVEEIELKEGKQWMEENVRPDKLLSLSVPGERTTEPELDQEFLDILDRPFRKELAAASVQPLSESYLRPTAVFPYHRSLSIKARDIPWKELEQLGLALENARDHHPEMLLVGGLIAALYLNKTVYRKASAHSNGVGSLKYVALHTAHLLKQEEKRLATQDLESARLKYVRSCLKSLETKVI